MDVMPKWAEVILVPLISLLLAALLSALVILAIGEDPIAAVKLMVTGALGSSYGWGYTLYYATNFMFTGLAVAVAFHARLFNIGGEGQAALGGLGVALACLYIPWPHWSLALIGAAVAAGLFGAAWAAIPAWLQAKRGSHIVITTIMFNFIAASLLNYVLVNVLRPKGFSESAARYAGMPPVKIIMVTMMISGALAGMMAINNVMGEAERLVLNSVEGAGFIGIAVALMGRSHPLGVFFAAILFGFLYQGGAELALWTSIPRELIVVIQALVILFTGALDNMVRMPLERLFLALRKKEA